MSRETAWGGTARSPSRCVSRADSCSERLRAHRRAERGAWGERKRAAAIWARTGQMARIRRRRADRGRRAPARSCWVDQGHAAPVTRRAAPPHRLAEAAKPLASPPRFAFARLRPYYFSSPVVLASISRGMRSGLRCRRRTATARTAVPSGAPRRSIPWAGVRARMRRIKGGDTASSAAVSARPQLSSLTRVAMRSRERCRSRRIQTSGGDVDAIGRVEA